MSSFEGSEDLSDDIMSGVGSDNEAGTFTFGISEKTLSSRPQFRNKGSRIHELGTGEEGKRRVGSGRVPTYFEHSSISARALQIMQSRDFEMFFAFVIIANAAQMGLALVDSADEYSGLWLATDIVFSILFIVETTITLIALGHTTFYNFWKAMLVMVTIFAVGDCAMTVSGLGEEYIITSKTLNSLRFLLVFKLFALNRETKLIVTSMVRSFKSLRGVLVVICVICYGCTLIVYNVVGLTGDEYDDLDIKFGNSPHFTYFGTVPRTLLTLFSLLILSEWDSVARGIYEVQPYFVFFFVIFTIAVTFGLLNVLIGITVDTVNQIHAEHQELLAAKELAKQKLNIDRLVEVIFGDDDDITLDEFLLVSESEDNEQIAVILREFKVPWHFTFGDLFTIIDDDQDGHVTKTELSDGLFSLVAGDDTARFCMSQLCISKSHMDIVHLRDMVVEMAQSQHLMAQCLDLTRASVDTDGNESVSGFQGKVSSGASMSNQVLQKPKLSRGKRIGRQPGRKPGVSSDDLWRQCYSSVHSAVEKHCKRELDMAWQELQGDWSSDVSSQENYVIRNKLHNAVALESAIDLRKAINLAMAAGIDSKVLAIELTYNDVLKRSQPQKLPTAEVQNAMESGDWSTALDLIVESAVANGADKHILANVITQVADGSNNSVAFQSGRSALLPWPPGREPTGVGREPPGGTIVLSTPTHSFGSDCSMGLGRKLNTSPVNSGMSVETSVAGRAGNVRKFATKLPSNKSKPEDSDAQAHLLPILHAEACKHSSQEMNRAWEAIVDNGEQKRFKANQSPLSAAEELFFVYNQMANAVDRQSLPDLQRALTQAVVAGLDIRSLDVEVAYRDALARYHKGTTHTVRLAVDAFRRKEWYLALELVIQICITRGADRQSLLRALTKVYAGRNGFDQS